MRTFILFVFRPWFLFINLVACGCVFVYELFLDLLSTFLNDFKVSMLVGSMCLWERYKDLCVVLCILVYEWWIFVIVEIGITLLLSPWYVNVLSVRVFHSLVFYFKFMMLLFLLRSLLIPHTHVCGLSWGRCFNNFMHLLVVGWGVVILSFLSTAIKNAFNGCR